MKKPYKFLGFTLSELAIVVVILGSVAALAIPNVIVHKKRVCNAEGEMILQALAGAQKDYFLDYGAYATNSSQLSADYAAVSNSNSGCFNAPAIESGVGPWISNVGSASVADYIVASVQAADGSYTLYGTRAGTVECFGNTALCTKMGYKDPTPPPPRGGGGC